MEDGDVNQRGHPSKKIDSSASLKSDNATNHIGGGGNLHAFTRFDQ